MDEDQNSDLSYGQIDHSVGIFQCVFAYVEEERDLEQLKVNYHEEIWHSEIQWAWISSEYERKTHFHIQDLFFACYGQALPKVC